MTAVGGQYFLLDQGYIRFAWKNFSLEGGYLKNLAPFDDPYELFLNPQWQPISRVGPHLSNRQLLLRIALDRHQLPLRFQLWIRQLRRNPPRSGWTRG